MQRRSIEAVLSRIDGRGYKAYKELQGARQRVGPTVVEVTRVQGDPFAPPRVARLEARVEPPAWARGAEVAVADYL